MLKKQTLFEFFKNNIFDEFIKTKFIVKLYAFVTFIYISMTLALIYELYNNPLYSVLPFVTWVILISIFTIPFIVISFPDINMNKINLINNGLLNFMKRIPFPRIKVMDKGNPNKNDYVMDISNNIEEYSIDIKFSFISNNDPNNSDDLTTKFISYEAIIGGKKYIMVAVPTNMWKLLRNTNIFSSINMLITTYDEYFDKEKLESYHEKFITHRMNYVLSPINCITVCTKDKNTIAKLKLML